MITAENLTLTLTEPGVNAAEAFAVAVASGPVCGYITRRDGETRWSAHTDNGIFLGATPDLTSALWVVAAYYA